MKLYGYSKKLQELAKQAGEDNYQFLSSMLWIMAGCLEYTLSTKDETLLEDLINKFTEHGKKALATPAFQEKVKNSYRTIQ